MSFFAGLDTEAYDRKYTDRQLAKRMAVYFRPHTRSLVVVVILLLIIAISSAVGPIIVARGVDMLGTDFTWQSIILLCGAILLAGVISWAANWGRRRLSVRMIGDIILSIRTDAFQASMDHDLSFYDQFSSGRVVSRITSDTQEFGQTVTLIADLISQIIEVIFLGIVLIIIDLRLSLVLFSFLPIIFIVVLGFRRIARVVTRRGMRAMANVNAAIKETISGIAVAKNFRQEASIFTEFDYANKQSYKVNVQRGLVLSMVFPVLNALGGIGTAVLVYVGGMSVIQGLITIGVWYLFLQSLDYFFFPVLNLSAFWAQVQAGLSAAERAFGLIDAESKVVQIDSRPAPILKGDIRFENITFKYEAEKDPVLMEFNLDIKPGENIALVGHTGAGKSSIARLIARFYEFQQGSLLIDGLDIRSLDLSNYRSQLGIVSQAPFLFSGTIAENICYACGQLNLETIEEMALGIGNGEWLESLPQGLETQVGERGSRLSMGQRQIVSLLRVLAQQPAIFILDEATASIDPFTEWQIQQALGLILSGTTSILIAHRLSTVKAADRIIVLEQGRIIEQGDHQNLLDKGGHYASLYNTYFRHQSLEYVEQSRKFAFK
ncbi:MAG: ABC transporter ATP-binding protein [Anaerolineales bacterium]|nr:ABC transporter ATP-binding protein/permease [Anaerolineales bacterium]